MANWFSGKEKVFSDIVTISGGITRHWEYQKYAIASKSPKTNLWTVDMHNGHEVHEIGRDLHPEEVKDLFLERVNTQIYVPTPLGSPEVRRLFEPGESTFSAATSYISVTKSDYKSFRDHPDFESYLSSPTPTL